MSKQQNDVKVGFETLSEDENSIVLKRVLTRQGSKKDKSEIEMSLPKLTLHLFDEEDLQRLKEIEEELSSKSKSKTSSTLLATLDYVKNILMK